MNAILCRDAMTFEDAYWGERPPANKVVPIIIEKLKTVLDPYTRGKLIELLGESEDKSVLTILENELKNEDEFMRNWAKGSIRDLENGEKWQQDPKYL